MNSSDGRDSSLDALIEEFLTRVENGENPDQEDYLRCYPDQSTGLRAFFDDLNFVDTRIATQEAAARMTGIGRYFPDSTYEPQADEPDPLGGSLPRIGGFELIEEIGSGSQGVVYKARQLGTKRIVAVKVIRAGAFAGKAERRRFESEIEFASRLSHPNIVAIYHCGQDAGRDFFAMEFIDGEPLDTYLPTHMLTVRETLDLFLQVCDAVGYAHQRGVIHRDLKPSNVLVTADGQARILDFGLAKTVPNGSSQISTAVTQMGDFAGTWYYASPEQAGRDPTQVDVRSDVYSLGVILHEMLTDCYPYPIIDEPRDVIARHIQFTPASRPSSIRSEVDDELDTIVLFALQKERERRYQSAVAFAEDVRRYLAGEPIAAKRDSAWYVLRKTLHRYRWPVAGAGVAVAALLAFAVTVSILYSQAVTARRTTELRTHVVRESQKYLMDKLDQLNYKANRLADIAEAYPELPEVIALQRLPVSAPLDELSQLVRDMPDQVLRPIRLRSGPGYEEAVAWLDAHAAELERVAESLKENRFLFGIRESDESMLASKERFNAQDQAGQRLCEAYAAQALLAGRRNDLRGAAASLGTATQIRLDLADPGFLATSQSAFRGCIFIYDATLTLLHEAATREQPVFPLAEWALRDPPFPDYRTALILERHKLAQDFESMTVPAGPNRTGVIDFEALGPKLSLNSPRVRDKVPLLRRIAQTSSPQDALAALDYYFAEIEQWGDLTFPIVRERRRQLLEDLSRMPAWEIVSLGVTRIYPKAFLRQRATRSAMILAAKVTQHRASTGQWPANVTEVADTARQRFLTDPYTGLPFGYRLTLDGPVIYSVNEDGVDDGGKPGVWGEDGTDVVFFPPGP